MATKTKQSVEDELLEAAEIKGKADDESAQKYLKRVVKACDDLDEKVWENLTQESQEWLADAVAAVNKKSDIPEFPGDDEDDEEDDDEEKPAKKKAKASAKDDEDEDDDDEEDEDDDDDDEEEKPAKKKAPKADDDDDDEDDEDEDEEDEKPAKKKASKDEDEDDEDDEEEEKPAKKAAAVPAEDPAKKKAAIAYTRRLVCKHPDWSMDKVKATAEKKGHELSDVLNKIICGDTLATLKTLEGLQMLCDPPDEE